jgi:hypothetical protein
LFGDQHRLFDIIDKTPAAEAAAEHDLVNLAFLRRQAGGGNNGVEGGLAVLRSGPTSHFSCV